MRTLRHVNCKGATAGGNASGRTRIRVIQYAMYDKRGLWIAKRLRNLWNAGCDVKIIFAAVNRPVLNVLKSRSGRGRVPMRQSVIRNGAGDIVKYNHSKWMTISGRYGRARNAWVTLTGSANWGNVAFSNDEVTQQLNSATHTRAYLAAFTRTWRQKSSRAPRAGAIRVGGRVVPDTFDAPEEITFGRGEFKYMTEH
jgi:phosphatidylserine/phosphatidylglycerophosphate/cardiolipin synthase-like enzyme